MSRTMLLGIFKKELRLFFGRPGPIAVSIIFSLSLFTLFRFSLGEEGTPRGMVLWVTHFLSILFLLIRSQEWEREEKAYRLFLLSRINLGLILWGKTMALVVVILFLWLIEVAVWMIFFDLLPFLLDPMGLWFLYYIALTGLVSSLALGISGVQASAIAIHSEFPLVMLFVIFLPLNLPVLVSSAQLIMIALQELDRTHSLQPIFMILAFLMFYAGAGVLLFDQLFKE